LSNICENTAIGRYPRVDGCIVSRLEFVSISRERSLAVLVFDDGRTKQRIFEHPDVGSDLNLHQVHGYFGLHWAGRSLNDIRNGLRDALQRAEHSDRKRRILEVTRSAIHDAETPDSTVIVEGLTFVLNEDLASSQATTLLSALDDKRLLLELLDQFIDEPGARLIFGSETKIPALKDCALVSVPYGIVGKRRGVVAILGGVRMDYGKIMPWVGFAGRAISAALEHKYSAA
jgi:heat-inducible transcriptional repressor